MYLEHPGKLSHVERVVELARGREHLDPHPSPKGGCSRGEALAEEVKRCAVLVCGEPALHLLVNEI